MDKLDFTGQPAWLVSFSIVSVGVVVPIVLALIGRKSGKKDESVSEKTSPIEIETPWLVQNILEIKMVVENIEKKIGEISVQLHRRR